MMLSLKQVGFLCWIQRVFSNLDYLANVSNIAM